MRVVIVVLAAFALLFVVVGASGFLKPPPDQSSTATRPASAASFASAWAITPAFLKASRAELLFDGATLPDVQQVTLAPGGSHFLIVRGATAWYQSKRMVHLILNDPQFTRLSLAYPPIAQPPPPGSDALDASNPSETIVLPQAGGTVTLSCLGPSPCAVSL